MSLVHNSRRPFCDVLREVGDIVCFNSTWSWFENVGSGKEKKSTENVGDSEDREERGRGGIDEVWRSE